jgi:hypothetical protein
VSLHSCLLAVFSAAVFALEASAGFLPPVTYAVGSSPRSVAVGDFNGDHIPDLAVTNYGDDTVSILLGRGDGTFQATQSYGTWSGPSTIVVADFNGDGALDLAVATYYSVNILLGNGDGTFQAVQYYYASIDPFSVAVGDFNGDGHPDLAVVGYLVVGGNNDSRVSILLGAGDGTFQAAQSYTVGFDPLSVAVEDLNGDGYPDLIVANSAGEFASEIGSVSILLGNGDGTFQDAKNYAAGPTPLSVAVGDLNGDGHPDLAVATDGSEDEYGGVTVLLGNGDGTFQEPKKYDLGVGFHSVAVGDLNRDGHPDLAVIGYDLLLGYSRAVDIFLSNGDGTLQAAQSYPVGQLMVGDVVAAEFVAVGDFNGDGFPDLAVVTEDGVAVLLNDANWGGP